MSVLVVEDGTGLSTANAFITVAEADAYFSHRHNSMWSGSSATKEAAIINGTLFVDRRYIGQWPGAKLVLDQALQWPRDDGDVPQPVKDATCEAALRALSGDLVEDVTTGVRSKNIANVISTVYAGSSGNVRKLYPVIDLILSNILTCTSDVIRG